jgi:invasin-like protein
MTKQTATRAALLIALFAAPSGSALAAGPFQLRRATTAQAVSTSPAAAVFLTSPYDGEPIASGGVSYDYAVYDASGTALDISVQIDPATQTLRIAFDDGNPTSAPVNASTSAVTVAPASILADGLQRVTISILPRDASGVPLGRGLTVAIDPSLLWPATLTGPVVDLGDGSYVATAVASVPGTGLVRAVVEGVSLAPSPTITVNPVDPSMSQRDLAISELLGEVQSGGPLSTLIAEAGGSAPQLAALNGTINAINTTASMLANSDPSKDDNILKTQLGEAMIELEEVWNTPGTVNPLDVRDAMDDLLGIARLVAQWHLDQAVAACGVCAASGSGKKVCTATTALATADGMRAAVVPDWSATLDEYAMVVTLALQAQQTC